MQPQPNIRDPEGHYARLSVDPGATAADIVAAWRRMARALHPDVPGTGNADAFIAARRAYDVLGDPARRSGYDRAARLAALEAIRPGDVEREPARAAAAEPRRSDLDAGWPAAEVPPLQAFDWLRGIRRTPALLAAGLAAVMLIAIGQAAWRIAALPATHPAPAPSGPAMAPTVSGKMVPLQQPLTAQPILGATLPGASSPPPGPSRPPDTASAAPVRLAGVPNAYVIPAAGPALVFRHDADRKVLVSIGQLPPFSAVAALRLFRQVGMVEIRLTETTNGLIELARLARGDTGAAHRAYCGYNAGPPPANGEVVVRRGTGNGRLSVDNRVNQPVVLKLRDRAGIVAAAVYLSPNGHADIGGLPERDYRPDFAVGELWSRACSGFAAGMRAQRLSAFTPLGRLSPLTVPPGAISPELTDITEPMFERDE